MARIIDLTAELEPSAPDYLANPEKYLPPHILASGPPVLMRTEIYPIWVPNWESKNQMDRRRVHKLECMLHAYTHSEAPAHLVKGGKFIHEYPIEHWVAKACVMNFADKRPGSKITPEDLEKQWVEGCEALIVRTDWQKRKGGKGFDYTIIDDEMSPKYTMEAMNWIIAKKPKLYLEDQDCCPRPPGKGYMFEADICHVMNAINIDQINKKVVTLIALPLKLRKTTAGEGVEATPTRAIAIEE